MGRATPPFMVSLHGESAEQLFPCGGSLGSKAFGGAGELAPAFPSLGSIFFQGPLEKMLPGFGKASCSSIRSCSFGAQKVALSETFCALIVFSFREHAALFLFD